MAVDFTQGVGSSTTYLTLGSAVVTTFPISMFCWFNPLALTVVKRTLITVQRPNDFDYFALVLDSTTNGTKVIAQKGHSGFLTGIAYAASAYSAGSWQSAGAVWASSASTFAYYNGTPGAKDTASYVPAAGLLTDTYIATSHDNSGFFSGFTGCLAKAVVWNAELSDSDFASLHSGTDPRTIKTGLLKTYLALAAAASAGANEYGSNFTANTGAGSITDCGSSPPDTPPTPPVAGGRRWFNIAGPVHL